MDDTLKREFARIRPRCYSKCADRELEMQMHAECRDSGVSFSVTAVLDNLDSCTLRPESPRHRVRNPRWRRALVQHAQNEKT